MIFPCAPRISLPDPFSPLLHFSISFTFQKPSLKHYYSTKPSLGQGCECKCIWINVCSVVQIFLTKKLFRSVVSFYLLKSFQALEVLSFDRDLTFSRFCFPSISSCRFCLKHLFLYSKAGNEAKITNFRKRQNIFLISNERFLRATAFFRDFKSVSRKTMWDIRWYQVIYYERNPSL